MAVKKKGRLRRLIDHLPVVVFEYTFFPDGHRDFTFISPHCTELLGLQPEDITNGHLSIHSFIHPDDWATFDESVRHSVEAVLPWRWQGRCKGKKNYLWLEAKGSPVTMKDGRIVYNGIFSDITEQKILEHQQKETEQRYRDLVEQLPLGIAVQANGQLKLVNAAAARMIGAQDPRQMLGADILDFSHPDYAETAKKRIESVFLGKPTGPMEEKYIRLDGKELEVESSGYPYRYEGEPAVQLIFTDITEKKKTEASFLKAETLFSQLFQNTPLAIVLLNEDGKVVQINQGFEELFNYGIEELKGKVLNEYIIPQELEPEGNDINSLITENRVIRVETIRHRKNGKKVSVIIYGVPVLLQDRKIGIFGMYVDITERKKVEEELKVRNTELDNFVYKVSHDLRAPLSSVLGLAHLATLPGNDDNLVDYVKLMGQKARQLDHFISDVLSHSKNLKMEVKVQEIDFQRVIDQIFNDLNYLSGADKVSREMVVSGGIFCSDPWRIGEILRNLVSNAIKYRKLDSDETQIDIRVDVDDKYASIVFEDDGIGIEKGRLTKIFEMFYRASDQSEGSGLGLYIVKNAVDKLGGRVTVDSEPGQGTSFKIVLPNLRLSK